MGEDFVELASQTLAAEDVDGPEVWRLHTAEPHVGYVLNQKFLHLTAGVHIVQIGIDNDLEEHSRIVTAGSATLITSLDFGDVEPIYDCTHHS